MNLGELAAASSARRLRSQGLAFRTGRFAFRIRSDVPAVHRGLHLLYAEHPLVGDGEFCDFTLDLRFRRGLRRWIRPQVQLFHDHAALFEPMPAGHAMPLLEWSMNWCISATAHDHLVMHAAVLERDGDAVVLPAPPGSGKSTLCAALMFAGWRLLSDELALLSLADGRLWPLARPVSLKNRSIDVIRSAVPSAVFGEASHDTAKGTIAHLKVPGDQVMRADEPASPRWIVFPKWTEGVPLELAPRSRSSTLVQVSRNAFNVGVAGREGFAALAGALDRCDCYDLRYSSLPDAIAAFDRLAEGAA